MWHKRLPPAVNHPFVVCPARANRPAADATRGRHRANDTHVADEVSAREWLIQRQVRQQRNASHTRLQGATTTGAAGATTTGPAGATTTGGPGATAAGPGATGATTTGSAGATTTGRLGRQPAKRSRWKPGPHPPSTWITNPVSLRSTGASGIALAVATKLTKALAPNTIRFMRCI